jgi:hypothetical protein
MRFGFFFGVGLTILLGLVLLIPGLGHPASLAVSWEANTEPDLAGYSIYLDTAPGGGADGWKKLIDLGKEAARPVPESPARRYYIVTGLADQTAYYIVLTAYDTSANVSGFSNEASHTIGDKTPTDPPKAVEIGEPPASWAPY